jgi:hypothetical protein
MSWLAAIQDPLNWASLALSLILLLRLPLEGLQRTYKWFFLLLLVDSIRTAVLLALPLQSTRYGYAYMLTAPLIWLAYFLVLRELWGVVLSDHRGIESLALQVMYIGLAVAVVLSVVLSYLEMTKPGGEQKYPILTGFFIFHRVVVGILLLMVLLLGGFLMWFPVQLRRNVVYYAVGYVIYFLSKSVLLLVRNVLEKDVTMVLSAANLLIGDAVLLFWIVRLNARGQESSISVGHRWNREEADAAVEQLKAINQALIRAGRQ